MAQLYSPFPALSIAKTPTPTNNMFVITFYIVCVMYTLDMYIIVYATCDRLVPF